MNADSPWGVWFECVGEVVRCLKLFISFVAGGDS